MGTTHLNEFARVLAQIREIRRNRYSYGLRDDIPGTGNLVWTNP